MGPISHNFQLLYTICTTVRAKVKYLDDVCLHWGKSVKCWTPNSSVTKHAKATSKIRGAFETSLPADRKGQMLLGRTF